ncbi:MAG: type II secretion system F family protein [Holophagaceae bacterium]|jgi:type IV pilus assembly protein PilC|nr:hypothetical protein [Acidobacteriota bacterium]
MKFKVKYTTRTGETLHRIAEGLTPKEVEAQFKAQGFFVLRIEKEGDGRRTKEIKIESLILFNQELLALLKAGIPLLQSLELLKDHGQDADLENSLQKVIQDIKEGFSFSEAIAHQGGYPPVYQSNVVAGEKSGSLPQVLDRWLRFQRFAQSSKRKILEALFYPSFLVVVLFLAVGVILNVVLPRFADFYSGGDIELPLMTQALLSLASFLQSTFLLQIIFLLGLVGFVRWLWVTPSGQAQGERVLLRIPKLGKLYRMYHSSVFCRTLGVLLSGGLPVVQSLEIVSKTCPSPRLQGRLALITEEVRSGSPLHQSISKSDVVDPLAAEMIRVGESSSALSEMLDHVADFFDQEIEKATVAVTNLIGPVLIVFMGVVVLGLLLAVYVPLFNASNVIR